jgi:hypothetical protein
MHDLEIAVHPTTSLLVLFRDEEESDLGLALLSRFVLSEAIFSQTGPAIGV